MPRTERHPIERPSPSVPDAPRRRRPARAFVLALAALALLAGDAAVGQSFPASPPRNRCTPDPGHVECLDDHAGLIHGAVIHLPTSKLACRAFRQLKMVRYQGKSSRAETREVVVAGVCEQTAAGGELIRRWSTIDPLPTRSVDRQLWSSLAVALPPPVVRLISHNGGSRKNWTWSGYYLPRGWDQGNFHDPTAPADLNPWPPLGSVQAWSQPPAGGESVESPLYDRPVSCTPGFVVCSPYLTILHPDRSSPEVRVGMVSARRYFRYRTRHGRTYEHDATILHEVFTDPGADGGVAVQAAAEP